MGRRSQPRSQIIRCALVIVFVCFSYLALSKSSARKVIEPRVFDLWLTLAHAPAPDENVIVIRLDDATYESLGLNPQHPFPRENFRELLDVLATVKPRAVGIDIRFKGRHGQSDEALAAAIRAIPSVLPGGYQYVLNSDLSGRKVGVRVDNEGDPLFTAAAKATGLSYMPSESLSGSMVRELRWSARESGIPWERDTFAEAIAMVAGPRVVLPAPHDLINYYGPLGTIKGVSASQVLARDTAVLEALRDKVLLVGYYVFKAGPTPSSSDTHNTSFGGMFGIEIEATEVSNILRGDWIRRVPADLEAVATVIILCLFAIGIFLSPPLQAALLFGSAVLLWGGVTYGALRSGYYVSNALALLILLPVFVLSNIRGYRWERGEIE